MINAKATYIVPATRVLIWVFSVSSSLAKPKSDIFGFKSASSNTLEALISLCTILNLDSSWRNARPFAMPMQILNLVGQSNLSCWFSLPTEIMGPYKHIAEIPFRGIIGEII